VANGGARKAFYRDDVRARVERFANGSLREGVLGRRDRSYDHCYNYFAATKHPTRDMEKSCAILGFYLASWGMYRGSSYLFNETSWSSISGLTARRLLCRNHCHRENGGRQFDTGPGHQVFVQVSSVTR
jgi:hypothetical protein